MNKKQKMLVGVLVLFVVVVIGTSCVQDAIIPCHIDKEAIVYSGEDATMYVPWTTIFDADRIQRKMNFVHQMRQEEVKRLIVDDNMLYIFLNDLVIIGMTDAQQIKSAVFDPAGPLGLLLAGLPMFGLGALLIRKPGDNKLITELKNEQGKQT